VVCVSCLLEVLTLSIHGNRCNAKTQREIRYNDILQQHMIFVTAIINANGVAARNKLRIIVHKELM